jgi:hypothetical protein
MDRGFYDDYYEDFGEDPDDCELPEFLGDEEGLARLFEGFASEFCLKPHRFDRWRAQQLKRASVLVLTPYIAKAVRLVALEIEEVARVHKRGLSSKRVRDILKACKHNPPRHHEEYFSLDREETA